MPNPFSRTYIILFVLLLALSLSGCGVIYNSEFIPAPDQEISGPIEVGPEWVEIVAPKPLIPYKTIQKVQLAFGEVDYMAGADESRESLALKGGKRTKIEAVLFDNKGESYDLSISSIGGEGGGAGLSRKTVQQEVDGKTREVGLYFPEDRTFTKLKIKSSIPIKLDKIKWVCYSNK